MARDVNLQFVTASTDFAGTGDKGSEKDCEGGFYAMVRLFLGTITGTTVVCDIQVLCSIDGGTTDFHIGQFPTIDEADDDIEIARLVYVPKPDSSNTVTKVKLNTRVSSGTSPVVPVLLAFLEPLVSLAIPGVDEQLTIGVEKLI